MTETLELERPPASPAAKVEQPFLSACFRNVRKVYRNGVVAVQDLDLELRGGKIAALLGPNGAGKSTAVRLLLGLCAPSAGTVRVFGADPRSRATRLRTGVMLQVGDAPRMQRVGEQLELFRGYYPHPLPMADLLRTAALEGLENRLFGQLSGGQKQRVLFALALAGDPDLLILDEPTVGLDIEARRAMWSELRDLRARGKAILLTTHYLEEADALADRIIILGKGRILMQGTPHELKQHGSSGHPARAIRCVCSLPGEVLAALPAVRQVERDGPYTVVLSGNPEATLRAMLARDPELHSLSIDKPSLEEAFLALTQQA